MRIALVTNRYPVDGVDAASPFVHDFCVALRDRGVEVRVLTPYYPTDRAERDEWVTRFRWSDSDRVLGQMSLWKPIQAVKVLGALQAGRGAARSMVNEFRPDYILGLWAIPSGWWAMHAASLAGIPYGIWCLGSDIQSWGRRIGARGLVRRILQGARHVYADGYALADEAAALSGRACTFLPSLRRLSLHDAGQTPPITGRYFLYFGRLARDKGVLDLLTASRMLKQADRRIVFAGIADHQLDIEREIRRHGAEEKCIYVGAPGIAELPAYLRSAEALVIPSHRDSIPLVLGEALQCGTPVICSDLPDLCRLLQNYRVGSIFRVGEAAELARAMNSFRAPEGFTSEVARFLADFNPASAADRFLADVGGAESSVRPAQPMIRSYAGASCA